MKFQILMGALALSCGAMFSTPARANCVTRPVTIMVPYPAGGLSDVIARSINNSLSRQLGQPVIVENIGGAGGALAAQKVLSSPADGSMLFLGSPNEVMLTPLANAAVKLRHDQFVLLNRVAINPLVLLVRRHLPVQSIDELVTYARNPANRSLTYGSVGYGSLYHFAAEDLAARTGTTMVHVPYKGGAPLLQDLAGGQIDFTMLPWSTALRDMADQERLKILGWVSARRDSLAPDVPAFGEGSLVKGFEYATWAGLMVRKETAAPTVACLHQAIAKSLAEPGVQKAIAATGSRVAAAQTLEESAHQFAAEATRFHELVKSIKIGPQ